MKLKAQQRRKCMERRRESPSIWPNKSTFFVLRCALKRDESTFSLSKFRKSQRMAAQQLVMCARIEKNAQSISKYLIKFGCEHWRPNSSTATYIIFRLMISTFLEGQMIGLCKLTFNTRQRFNTLNY